MRKGEFDMDIDFEGTVRGDRLAGVCSSAGFEFPLKRGPEPLFDVAGIRHHVFDRHTIPDG